MRDPFFADYVNELSKIPKKPGTTTQAPSTQWLLDNPDATVIIGENWKADKDAKRMITPEDYLSYPDAKSLLDGFSGPSISDEKKNKSIEALRHSHPAKISERDIKNIIGLEMYKSEPPVFIPEVKRSFTDSVKAFFRKKWNPFI